MWSLLSLPRKCSSYESSVKGLNQRKRRVGIKFWHIWSLITTPIKNSCFMKQNLIQYFKVGSIFSSLLSKRYVWILYKPPLSIVQFCSYFIDYYKTMHVQNGSSMWKAQLRIILICRSSLVIHFLDFFNCQSFPH